MAVLPKDPFALNGNVIIKNEPGRTWFIDKESGMINGEVDGYEAVRQAVEILLRTDRYRWQIYRPSSGVDYRNLVGRDPGYVAMELRRQINEALSMDSRFMSLDNYDFKVKGDVLSVSFTVRTVYGDVAETMEVPVYD